MCLTNLTTKEPLTAKKDIVCWKPVMIVGGEIFSLYRSFIYKLSKRYKTKILFASEDAVEEGFHSYIKKRDCAVIVLLFGGTMVECIIPAGSKYYKGVFNHETLCPNYVSNQIIVKEIVE